MQDNVAVPLSKMKVAKRDGRVVSFDAQNIRHAVRGAYKDLGEAKADKARENAVVRQAVKDVEQAVTTRFRSPVHIDDIQSLVEHSLINQHAYDVARAYTTYRMNKDIHRAKAMDVNEQINRFLRRDPAIVHENANKDSNVYGTQRDLLAGTISRAEALRMLPKDVANAHLKGDIHFHDADYSPFTAETNCFARETRFVTSKGIKSFKDFKDGDTVTVLAPSGKWRKAVVHCYGKQDLNEITFVRNGRSHRTIYATANHRWILEDGSVTTNLQPGEFIKFPPVHKTMLSKNAPDNILMAWLHGFVYGDGGQISLQHFNVCNVRLCGHKAKYEWIFKKLGYHLTYPQYAHGDSCCHLSPFNKKPDLKNMSPDEISAFFEGYMDADGSYTNGNTEYKSVILATNRWDNFNIIENWSAVAGYHILSVRDVTGQHTNYTPKAGRPATHWYRFLIGKHNCWKVESIAKTDRHENVWCLVVDKEHAFVLDGGIVTSNCSLPNFKDMLAHGFSLGNAEMGSPKSIEIAATQVSQVMQDVASSQYGGQTFNRADEVFAKYAKLDYEKNMRTTRTVMPDDIPIKIAQNAVNHVYKLQRQWLHFEPDRPDLPMDKPFHKDASKIEQLREIYAKILTRKNIYDAMQTLEYQINSNRVSNGQTPFVTLGFGLGTDWFAREITRCIFLNRIRGLGYQHRTAIFPKLTYTIKYGLNSVPGDPNYDLKELAVECSTKRMYPDILFYENIVKITGSFKAPMGCRSFLQKWTDPKTGKDVEDGRMNLGVITINIPRIALESGGDKKKFWDILDQRLAIAHKGLQFRIKRCEEAKPKNAPVLWEYGAFGRLPADGDVSSLMKNGRATVSLGYIGIAEAVSVFYGPHWIKDHSWNEDGRQFGLAIVRRLHDACVEWEKQEGYHYSVYSTPAESLTDTFNREDRQKFGRVPGVTDHDFYTNSFHYPVWLKPTPFEKLKYEVDFPYLASGGFINYCEYPTLQQNPKALEAVWDYAHKIGIGYLGTNTPIDKCYVCGYEGDFEPTEDGFKCPNCGNNDPAKCSVTKRTCGYLGNPLARPMVHGRHQEIIHRVKHMDGETGKVVLKNGDEIHWWDDMRE